MKRSPLRTSFVILNVVVVVVVVVVFVVVVVLLVLVLLELVVEELDELDELPSRLRRTLPSPSSVRDCIYIAMENMKRALARSGTDARALCVVIPISGLVSYCTAAL